MRVLLVNAHGADPAYGGAERYVRDLALGLSRRGHEPVVLSAFPPRADAGVETHVLHGSDWRDSRLRRARNHAGDVASPLRPRLERLLHELRPDLVHTSNLPGIGTGIWELARRREIPVVHTLHDYHLLCPRTTLTRRDGTPCCASPRFCSLRRRRLARWAPAVRIVLAGSDHLLRVHRGLFPEAERRVVRLPLAPLDGPAPEPPEELRTLGYLGALTVEKGVRLLLEAAPLLAREGAELRLAGDGPLRAEVEAAPVRFAGRVEGTAKLEFLRECDVGVVPSLWEEPSGPPYVVREWVAARRPVLATRRGGLAETTAPDPVVSFEADVPGLLAAVAGLRDPEEWLRVRAALPAVSDGADVERWLDEHERAYGDARVGTAAGPAA